MDKLFVQKMGINIFVTVVLSFIVYILAWLLANPLCRPYCIGCIGLLAVIFLFLVIRAQTASTLTEFLRETLLPGILGLIMLVLVLWGVGRLVERLLLPAPSIDLTMLYGFLGIAAVCIFFLGMLSMLDILLGVILPIKGKSRWLADTCLTLMFALCECIVCLTLYQIQLLFV